MPYADGLIDTEPLPVPQSVWSMEVETSKAPGVLGGAGRMRSSCSRFPKAAFLGGSAAGLDPERPRFRSAAFEKEDYAAVTRPFPFAADTTTE